MSPGGKLELVVVLSGTAEARALADTLNERGVFVLSSLAGRVEQPCMPKGMVRVGGFAGEGGFEKWLRDRPVRAVVDATHPFAQVITTSAASACARAGVPLLRLERPPWQAAPEDRWHLVRDLREAAASVSGLGARVLLTTGRMEISPFLSVREAWFLLRCISAPRDTLPDNFTVLLDKGPFSLESELATIDRHRIDLLITKDSGGAATQAKLVAARTRSLPVIMVQRPSPPDSKTVSDLDGALDWLQALGALSPQA